MFLVPTTRFSFAELEGFATKYFRSTATAVRKVTEYKAMAVSQTNKFKYRYLTKVRPLRRKFGLGKKITITPVPMPESEPKA